jgi:hypothetical protein
MRKVEAAMIAAIRKSIADPYAEGQQFKKDNTVVFCNGSGVVGTPGFSRWIEVILYDTVIAIIEPQTCLIGFYSGGFKTPTTKSRLNAVLGAFSNGFHIYQDKGQWYIYKGGRRYDRFDDGFAVTLEA